VNDRVMVAAFVGVGSNLDTPIHQVQNALSALDRLPQTRLTASSHLYRTVPWGVTDQPDFINAVAKLETTLEASDLMRGLLDIEREFGRRRDGERYGPRILDLDLLIYSGQRIDEPGLRIPHPRLHERAFVLVPLAEIAPTLDVPGQGRVDDLLLRVDVSGCATIGPADYS
jgi:2-amino-4-hydroxy-6-hydroxymethyldihydropteridine diphosphokinase